MERRWARLAVSNLFSSLRRTTASHELWERVSEEWRVCMSCCTGERSRVECWEIVQNIGKTQSKS